MQNDKSCMRDVENAGPDIAGPDNGGPSHFSSCSVGQTVKRRLALQY